MHSSERLVAPVICAALSPSQHPLLFKEQPASFTSHPGEAQHSLPIKLSFSETRKRHSQLTRFSISFCTHPEYFMAKAFSFVKIKKISLDLPKGWRQQTHIYNSGRAVEDVLRNSSGHSVSCYTKSVPWVVMGNKFL